ncbi:MAG: hypothetical protein A2297_00655 [Elusimicrobia bacterium RIFOXYB2_FULL_48_7]|nr:MAG: hypothetical protein A2297_00655 [Elusimicrobia bacterium RIFOXYB2_FULL_48_7]
MAHRRHYIRRRVYYWVVLLFLKSVRVLSFRGSQKLGAFFGGLGYHLVKRYSRIAEKNLKSCFPEKTDEEIRSLAKRVFINQGKNFFEFINFHKLNKENIGSAVKFTGADNFKAAFSQGKGVLMIAGHFSNWELLGVAITHNGFPLNVIARKLYIEELDELLLKSRESMGMKIIRRGLNDSPMGILRALKRNQCLAMLIDQNIKSVPGVCVDFFGRKALTPSGLASLALKTGAPVVSGMIIREDDDTFTVEMSKQVELIRTGSEEEDIVKNTQVFTGIIESYIRKYPAQWVWFHKRWDE